MSKLQEVETIASLVDKAVEQVHDEHPRAHLGASQIGKDCDRALWYGFRWSKRDTFSGRMLRLFDRGKDEEERFIKWMALAGIKVINEDANGRQFSFIDVPTGGHFSGSIDGFAESVPGAEKTRHIVEFKTHSEKSFNELKKNGVLKAKPEHYAQMQIYMRWTGLKRALYAAVNKNTDELYFERVHYDKDTAETLEKRAFNIVTAKEPPAGVSDRADWHVCKMCNFHELCHQNKLPAVNCRTCLHATPETTGNARWTCAKWQCDIPVEGQREGCSEHRYIPALISWAAVIDATDDFDIIYEMKGESHQPFVNGNKIDDKPAYSSIELKAIDPSLIGNHVIEGVRADMGGVVFEDDYIPF